MIISKKLTINKMAYGHYKMITNKLLKWKCV